MEYSWLETGPESSDDDKEKKDEKRRALGALTSRSSVEKEKEDNSTPAPKKRGLEDFFKHEDKAEKKKPLKLFELKKDTDSKEEKSEEGPKKAEKPSESQKDEDSEKTSSSELKEAAVEALREQLPINIARLEAELAATPEDTPEHEATETALAAERQLQQKAEDPSIEALPEIDAEFDRRIDELVEAQIAAQGLDAELSSEDIEDPLEATTTDTTNPPFLPIRPTRSDPARLAASPAPKPSISPSAASPVLTGAVSSPGAPSLTAAPSRAASRTSFSGGIGARPPETASSPLNIAVERKIEAEREKPKRASAFLTGTVVGYAIGHRGGRKRAEALFRPRVSRLEKEAGRVKKHLKAREDELQSVVRRQHEQHQVPQEEPSAEGVFVSTAFTPEKRAQTTHPKPAAEVLKHTVETAKTGPEASQERLEKGQPEARPLPLPKAEAEVVNIFERENDKDEKTGGQAEKLQITQHEIRQIEQLSTPELLHRAEMLYISGVNVKELYNTNQIDRSGLVKIIQESMRGRDIKAVFEKVELGRERQRERAREFRHDDTALAAAASSSQSAKPVIPPIAQPLGHTVIQDVKIHSVAAQHPPLNLPNTPDSNDLQPLQQSSAPASPARAEKVAESAVKIPAEFKLAAVAAVAIAVLIAWVILG